MLLSKRLLFMLMLFLASACGGGSGAGSALPAAAANVVGAVTVPSASPAVASAKPVVVAAPTATPTSGAVGVLNTSTYLGFANAADYTSGFTPFAAASVFNTKVSANPTLLANSAAIVANQFSVSDGGDGFQFRATEAGIYDYMHPRYFATTSDPVINLVCNQWCGDTANGGPPTTMYVPAIARPAGGSDAHFDVVQPNGNEYGFWATYGGPGASLGSNPDKVQSNWTTGSTLTAGTVTNCGSFTTGPGWVTIGPGPTAAGYCTDALQITAAELIAGVIPHAIFVGAQCAVGSQYPVESGGSTQQCTSGVGPPLGGREWYDVPDATTNATSLKPWEKAMLNALHDYGGYYGDNGGGGAIATGMISGETESEEPWRDYYGTGTNKATYTSPFAPLASQGWFSGSVPDVIGTASGTRWYGADPWNPWTTIGESEATFASHFHWLAPCSAAGTC